MRPLALAVALAAAAAHAAEPQVAVVPFQGLGVEPALVDRLADALRARLEKRRWTVLGAEATRTRQRAAAMCGEDVECLATLGQRLEAKYVVAFGLGRVGDGAMLSALVVDVARAKKLAEHTERLPSLPEDAEPVALRTISTLFEGLSPPVTLVPDVPPPPPPLVLEAPPPRPLRPWAVGAAVGAGVLAVAGGTLTVLAQQHYSGLPDVAPARRAQADSTQRTLNAAADATVITAGVAAAAALTLFLLDARSAPTPAGPEARP